MIVTIALTDQTTPAPNAGPLSPVTVASHPTNPNLVVLTVGDQVRTVLATELQTASNRAKNK